MDGILGVIILVFVKISQFFYGKGARNGEQGGKLIGSERSKGADYFGLTLE